MTLFGEVIKLLKKDQARHIAVFGGGIVPEEDAETLKRMGVQKVFTPGSPLDEIVEFVKSIGVKTARARAGKAKPLPDIWDPARGARRVVVHRTKKKRK
jgi:hypothetical protein